MFTTSAVSDDVTDADWITKADIQFVHNPGGTTLVIDTPEELPTTIKGLVRGLADVAEGGTFVGNTIWERCEP